MTTEIKRRYNRTYYEKHKEAVKERARRYYYANRERCIEKAKEYQKKTYESKDKN